MKVAVVAAMLALLTPDHVNPAADVSLTIIEYRALQSVGQVRLTSGYVHDAEIQKSLLADLAASDRRGIILVAGDSVRQFKRRETVGTHNVETTITVRPAIGHGYRGGLATAAVVVAIDGQKVVDCMYDGGETQLSEIDVFPRDGMVSVLGSHYGKHVQGTVSLKDMQTIDQGWLTRNTQAGQPPSETLSP
jgi:hypothetical protein